MKNMKKIVALLVAVLMLVSMAVPAFAEVEMDTSVSVTGLLEGDVVKLYQVITWDQTAGAWKLATGFTGLTNNTTVFPHDAQFTGTREEEVIAAIVDGITQDEANAIAALTKGTGAATAIDGPATMGTSQTTYTYDLTDANSDNVPDDLAQLGLYMGIITAGSPSYVYNPVFVSADFNNNATNSLDAGTETYGANGLAKKQTITVTKTTEDANSAIEQAIDSYVGQTVTFYVDTTIPVFLDSYQQPRFDIYDNIETSGIDLIGNSIAVTLNYGQSSAATYYATAGEGKTAYDTTKFTVTPNETTDEYTVSFVSSYLDGLTSAVPVRITYQGTITNSATFNLNEDDNLVTVTYSNGPTDEAAALRDRTNHYTFSIGAAVYGLSSDQGKTYELIKVGVDEDGKPVVAESLIEDWKTEVKRHPLAGAVFGLYTKNESNQLVPYREGQYANTTTYPNGATFETGADGVISFYGLAAGTYYIQEISAPSGYIKDTRAAEVQIVAHYSDPITVGATTMTDPVTNKTIEVAGYETKVLTSYDVIVDNVSILDGAVYAASQSPVQTTYEYNNDGPHTSTIKVTESDVDDSELVNTQGVALPSTGGMGTTILYIGGSILVILAAVLLITKRRMNAED